MLSNERKVRLQERFQRWGEGGGGGGERTALKESLQRRGKTIHLSGFVVFAFTNTPRSNMRSLSFNVGHLIFMGAGRVYLIESELQRLRRRKRLLQILLYSFLNVWIVDSEPGLMLLPPAAHEKKILTLARRHNLGRR